MPDTTITTTDQSLDALLLKRMLKKAPRVRAVVGLNLTNLVSTFQMLRGFYVETHIPQKG